MEILEATEGELLFQGLKTTHSSISTDSRTIKNNSIFVALKGPNHNAHLHLEEAVQKGATCLLASEKEIPKKALSFIKKSGAALIFVDDTLRALAKLARHHRNRARARVVAITGSNGKTSTRALTEMVLKAAHSVHSTQGNFNNEVGLPLTLFRLQGDEDYSILELGMNAPGEMTRLGHMAAPDIAVITCIGASHLEGLTDLDGVAKAKGELLDTLNKGAVVILNGDDPYLVDLAEKKGISPIFYGFSPQAHVRATNLSWKDGAQHFTLWAGEKKTDASLPLAGKFMVQNALAASAVGLEAGLDLDTIARALSRATTEKGRFTICQSQSGLKVIDDTYNANPLSVAAALETLAQIRGEESAAAVFGDMLELGDNAADYHREIGEKAALSGICRLYLTGAFAKEIQKGALKAGMDPSAITLDDKRALTRRICTETTPGEWVLVKGSRSMGMEQIVFDLISGQSTS